MFMEMKVAEEGDLWGSLFFQ